MSKPIKKVLSVLLCAALLFGAAPLNGFVGLQLPSLSSLFAVKAQAASGTCGTNLTWNYDETTATLTISGSGTMANYSASNSLTTAPWKDYSQTMQTLVLDSGVTSIGVKAFYGCSALTRATIPASITSVGSESFVGCSALTRVNISDLTAWCGIAFGAKSLSSGSYDPQLLRHAMLYLNDTPLTDLVIPAGVTSIGKFAFSCCPTLRSITIPASVTSISDTALSGCSGLTSITVNANNTTYYSVGNCLIETAGNALVLGCNNSVIPNTVTSIGSYAFEGCTGLTSVTIPDSVTSIGSYAFENCIGLTSITIPDSVTSIGASAFLNTAYYNDSSNWENDVLYIGHHLIKANTSILGNYEVKTGTVNILESAFSNCTGLTSVTIPDSVTSIGDSAFYGCSGLTSVTIPDGVTSIGISAFSNCTGLTSVTVPDSVTSIGDYAFYGCTGLTSMTLPFVGASRTATGSEGVFGFIFGSSSMTGTVQQYYASGSFTKYYIPSSLREITITDATQLSYGAFYNCSFLTSVTISDGVTSIDDSAFYGCTGLTRVTVPDSVTGIGCGVFYGCESLTDLTIPFVGASRQATGKNGILGYLFDRPDRQVMLGPPQIIKQYYSSSGSRNYEFPLSLQSITITDATQLSYGAFYGCSFLTNVILNDGISSIGNCAFYNCAGLTHTSIPVSVSNIGTSAFNGCTNLTDVYYAGSKQQWNTISIGSDNTPLLSASLHTATHSHQYTSVVTKAPTCSSAGIRTYTCECGSTYTELIAKLPHTPTTVSIPATCTENGRYYDVCEVCGERLSEDTIIPATGHHCDDGVVTQEPTCTQAGVKTYTCGDCGHTYTEPVAKLPHTPKTVTVPATCTENGRYYDVCEICGERLSEDTTIPATGHHYDDGVVTQEPTCTQTGVKTYTCGDCGHTYTETIPVSPHAPTDWIVLRQPVACTSTGLRVKICTACGETLETEVIPIPHRFGDWAVSTAATCTTAGEETRVCADCGAAETRPVAALGHDHIAAIIAPTCTEGGYTVHVCSRCGDTYTTDSTPAKGHTASDWQMAINPTATTDGKMCKYCVDCGIVMDEMTVPMLAGTHVTGVALSESEAYLNVGETLTLTAAVTPSSAADQTVQWISSDPDVATVENGIVTPVAPGTAVIIVQTTDRGYKDYCVVQVSAVAPQNGAVVSNGMIYGLNVNLSDLNEYLSPADETMSVEADAVVIGTGTRVLIKQGDTVLNEFEAVIFGDIDGNGWYDGTDAYFVRLVASGMISADILTAAQRMAADCNHDGVIDLNDAALLEKADRLLSGIDRSASAEELAADSVYREYCSLIDQSGIAADRSKSRSCRRPCRKRKDSCLIRSWIVSAPCSN